MNRTLPVLGSSPVPPAVVPAWLAKGFRPFFLLGGGFAALIMPLWLLVLAGLVRIDAYVGAMFWHAHEMVFGFTAAVIAGFLLTAVGNWTGRETAVGGRQRVRLVVRGPCGVSRSSDEPHATSKSERSRRGGAGRSHCARMATGRAASVREMQRGQRLDDRRAIAARACESQPSAT